MNDLLANPRVRMALFLVIAVSLVGLTLWLVLASRGDDQASQPETPWPTTVPSQTVEPTPGSSSTTVKLRGPVTAAQVRNLLEAYNTYSWQDGDEAVQARLVDAGIPKDLTEQADPYSPLWRDNCGAYYCSVGFTGMRDLVIGKDGRTVSVIADIVERYEGQDREIPLNCTVVATDPDGPRADGLFTSILCITPEG